MAPDNLQSTTYLLELFKLTKGDSAAQVSMYMVGANIGMEKTEAGKLAEDLIGLGWVEIKTLSGGIGITADGLQAVQAAGGGSGAGSSDMALGSEPVLTQTGRQTTENMLGSIKQGIHQIKGPYDRLEEVVVDIKTIEVQLLSPHPKTAVIREVLRSLHNTLKTSGQTDLAGRLRNIIGE